MYLYDIIVHLLVIIGNKKSILIMKANEMHCFPNLFDKVLHMFRTCPLSIIKNISTLYTRNRYLSFQFCWRLLALNDDFFPLIPPTPHEPDCVLSGEYEGRVTIYEPQRTINGKIRCRRDQLLIVSLNEPSTVTSISIFVGSEVAFIALTLKSLN